MNKYFTFSIICIINLIVGSPGLYAQDPTPNCEDFPPLCDLASIDGYMGRNPAGGGTGVQFCGPMTTIDNPGFVRFIALGTLVEFDLSWTNCAGTNGIQWAIYDNCSGVFGSPLICGGDCSGGSSSVNFSFSTTPGQIYSLMIDGCSGSQCDFTIDVVQGTGQPSVDEFTTSIDGPINICEGATEQSCITYTAEIVDRAVEYYWTYEGVDVQTSTSSTLVLPNVSSPGGQLCVQGINQCDSNVVSCIDLNIQPLPEVFLDTCVCWNDFPITIFGDLFDGPDAGRVIPLTGECGCPYEYNVTVDTDGEPTPYRVVEAICPDELIGGYRYPNQSTDDADFTMSEVRIITLTDAALPVLCSGVTLMCDDRIELDLRVLEMVGGDTQVIIPCDPGSVVLDTSHLEFYPLGDPGLEILLEWSGPSGVIASPDGSITVTDEGVYTVDITIFHALDDTFTECTYDVAYVVTAENCACITQPGQMDLTLIELCEGDQLTTTATVLPTLESGHQLEYLLHTNSGTMIGNILDRNTTGIFDYMSSYVLGQTYYVSVVGGPVVGGQVDINGTCFAAAVGQPVIWHQIPVSNAGSDDDGCGSYTFAAIASSGNGSWSQISGPGNSLFDMNSLPNATVTVDVFGTYEYQWTEDNNGCTDMDVVSITFRDSPVFVGVPSYECNSDNTSYTVTLNIANGDATSYSVVDPAGVYGGVLNGAIFTSESINISDNFTFEVSDQYGCSNDTATGMADCSCDTDAGELVAEDVARCIGQSYLVSFETGNNPVLDANDILQYEVSNGFTAAVVGLFTDPNIVFDPLTMTTGVFYVIRTIAGNDVGGNVDLSDPCADSSSPVISVTWFDLPVLLNTTIQPVCQGDSVVITYDLSGNPPFTLDITDGTSNYTVNNYTSGDPIKILITGPTDITLTSVREEVGGFCFNTINETYPIDVEVPLMLNMIDEIEVCNKALPGRITSVNFNDLVAPIELLGGSWEDLDNSGGIGTLPDLDFTDVTPGDYRFVYTTNETLIACENVSATILLIVSEDCPCPDIPVSSVGDLCVDQISFDLSALSSGAPGPGDWSVISDPGGANPMTITGSTLNVNGADAGVYELEFKLQNWPTTCPDSARQLVTLFDLPNPGVPNGSISFCEGEDLTMNAFDFIDGEDVDGVWSCNDPGVLIDASTGVFTTSTIPLGSYMLDYSVGPYGPCSSMTSQVELDVFEIPIADAGMDVLFTCADTLFTLGGSATTVGSNMTYQWFINDQIIAEATDRELDITSMGMYRLEVTNTMSNCMSEDLVEADVDANAISGLTVDRRDESCEGGGTGYFQVLAVDGGQEPYLYQLNNDPPVDQPLFDQLDAGDYSLLVTDAVGCNFYYSFVIEQGSALLIDTISTLTVEAGESLPVNLNVNRSPEDIALVNWSPNVALDCDTCLQVVLTPLGTGSFFVTITDVNGCEESLRFSVIVTKDHDIFIPNVFHPKFGTNQEYEIFRIYGSERLVQVNKLLIVDRWGNIVYRHNNFNPTENYWDGTRTLNGVSTGELLPVGVYVYYAQVQFDDGTTEDFAGDVTLLR